MLPKKHRLKTREVQLLFKFGFFSSNDILAIKFRRNQLNVFRFGVAVSSKLARRAVQRNKLRRRIYEIIRNNFQKIKPEFDYLIIPKTNGDLPTNVMEKHLLNLLNKNKLLNQQR